MKKFEPTLEHALYAIALAIGITLRFLHLGALPLSEYEARWALQAMQVAQGSSPAIGGNPAYVHLTAILFFIFDTTNFLARFWPALAGSILVLAPWFLRSRLGRTGALVLVFGLAMDPGLVAMSHLAGGPILAISMLILAGLVWMDGKRTLGYVLAGFALLSGPSIWFGLLGLVLSFVFSNAVKSVFLSSAVSRAAQPEAGMGETYDRQDPQSAAQPDENKLHFFQIPDGLIKDGRNALAWSLGTLLVVGSLLLLSPKGLPAFAMSMIDSLKGWWTSSGIPAWRLLLALPAYEILPLGFGIAGLVRGIRRRDSFSIFLGMWVLVALLLALIYPGRQMGDLVWALVPLWALAGYELSQHFDFETASFWEVAGVMTLVLSLVGFGWLDLAGASTMDLGSQEARMRLYLLAAVVVLILLSLLLIHAGWSGKAARLGGVWSIFIALTAFTFAMSTGAAGVREPRTAELWYPEPRSGRIDILLGVANQVSILNKGYEHSLPLTMVGVDSPALAWLFRDWQTKIVNALPPDASPELIISRDTELNLAAEYRGEPLPVTESFDWVNATPSNWLKWFIYRQMPVARQEVIFWVRNDLMLESQTETTP